ncbi:MAG: glutamate racemase [Gemmatimonadales bacterium]|nr:glutamate racemase [Gemmatimonadales bacterium]MDZ4390080.1 glutamate racemase [Gemmatimonadales bacterium]PKL93574.1 MAG: glutamate racemase [Gemmatimonadetes bacterium HGW-Gemmatimonadetes-1]
MTNNSPIGIFDSGIGGLTVARAVHQLLPDETTIYLGDTARVPYGPKSPATVRRYASEILEWLLAQQVKAVVIACNTATAHALDLLRQHSPVPVIGVIEPGARAAAAATRIGGVGVIGTAGTVASGAYRRALLALRPELRVVEQACPLFVPLVEEGWFGHPATRQIAEEYLAPVRAADIDVLVLGCTHYPLLAPLLSEVMGPSVTLIDSARETARELASVLDRADIRAPSGGGRTRHRWAATDDVARFGAVGAVFTGESLGEVELVQLTPEPEFN